MQKLFSLLLVSLSTVTIFSCGGGGGSDGATAQPGRNISLLISVEKKEPNAQNKRDPYVGYTVCVFGSCGTTNDRGEAIFGAVAPAGAVGMEFTVSGEEFNSIIGFPLKANATDVEATFLKPQETNQLEIALVKFDGVVDTSISADGFNDGD